MLATPYALRTTPSVIVEYSVITVEAMEYKSAWTVQKEITTINAQNSSEWQPSSSTMEHNLDPLVTSLPYDLLGSLPQSTELDPSTTNIVTSASTLSLQSPDLGFFPLSKNRIDPLDFSANNVSNSVSSGSPGVQEISTFPYTDSSGSGITSPSVGSGISSWHTNLQHQLPLEQRSRTLPRRRSRYVVRRSANETKSQPIVIHSGRRTPDLDYAQSIAMQRWQDSPPEQEGASLSAIYNALETDSSSTLRHFSSRPRRTSIPPIRRAPSRTSTDSLKSDSSALSGSSSQSAASQAKRRNHKLAARSKNKRRGRDMLASDRIFKCTFCCDTFKTKHDWARHERSLHLSMEEWACSPDGGTVVLPITGRLHCIYCSALEPTEQHLEDHNHLACIKGRRFRRKDHLVQHLRLVHGVENMPFIQDWKVELPPVTSRCGICDASLSSWDERIDHLGAHFREGKTMAHWRGEHGFDNAASARVTHAFPPYLIAHQSQTLVPFSATDRTSLEQRHRIEVEVDILVDNSKHAKGSSSLTMTPAGKVQNLESQSQSDDIQIQEETDTVAFVDLLARHLSKYAREQILAGIMPTDEMFQREARLILYEDADDEWNQTPADDQQWMGFFKARAGLRDSLNQI